jgi:hypothetical protein
VVALLSPALMAPSCASRSDRDPVAADSKRAIRQSGDPAKALIVKGEGKTLPTWTGSCLVNSPVPGPGQRVLTGVGAEEVVLYGVPGQAGRDLPTLQSPLRGVKADKAGHRWDFRLPKTRAQGFIRVEVRANGFAAENGVVPVAVLDFRVD